MSQNTWSRWLARAAVRPLVGIPITPNHLTTLRLVIGLMAVMAFATGTRTGAIGGGTLFVLAVFLDRADGELARLSGQSSAWGQAYDLICDTIVTVLVFVGIGIGLRHGPLGGWALSMGLIAGIAVALIFWLVARTEARGERLLPSYAGFDADDPLYLIGPAAWLGWLTPILVISFIGAPLVAVCLFWYHRELWLRRRQSLSQ